LTNHQPEKPVPGTKSLRDEVTRLTRDLAAARLESANRLAAIRAALGAAADGEADPLAYLRDQLAEEAASPGITGSGR
jgi:hypothetical protein